MTSPRSLLSGKVFNARQVEGKRKREREKELEYSKVDRFNYFCDECITGRPEGPRWGQKLCLCDY